jgi:uncharacterized protein (TIGR02300 family)
MVSRTLGSKYTCFKCGVKFYDLKRPDPLCPKCGADQRESPTLRPSEKSERRRLARAVVEEPIVPEEAVDEEALPAEEEEEAADALPDEPDDEL